MTERECKNAIFTEHFLSPLIRGGSKAGILLLYTETQRHRGVFIAVGLTTPYPCNAVCLTTTWLEDFVRLRTKSPSKGGELGGESGGEIGVR